MKVVATIAVLSAALVLASCDSNKPIEQPPQRVQVQAIQTAAEGANAGVRFSAMVMPDSQVLLAFRIPGYVVSLKQVRGQDGKSRDLAEGDRVNRGDALVRIRAAEYRDKVQQASSQAAAVEAAARKAKLDYDRASRLYEARSITKPEFDAACAQYDATQGQLKAAQAQISEAKIALQDTSLIAPFNGEIVKKAVEPGSFVGPGVPAFALVNTDTVKIVVGVPDTGVRSLKVGQPVEVSVDAFPQRTFRANISRIASAADPKTRNFEIEVAISNRDHVLKVGMIGSLQLGVDNGERQEPHFLVPLSAIVQSPDKNYAVFLVSTSSNNAIARLRTVEVGPVEGSEIRIRKGLASGDLVVTTGATLLQDGQRVEVLK